MIFNSFIFIWLFPIIFIIYYTFNYVFKNVWNNIGNITLLIISYLLYINWKPAYAILLLGITAITYISAIIVEKTKYKRKYIISTGVLLTILPLLIFKYYNFINTSITEILDIIGISFHIPGLNWSIPIGISFFTFQALGYLWDVYYGRIKAERNWLDYMLFVSFFPQIASGPISKACNLLPQIKSRRTFDYKNAIEGLKLLLWGMFLKVVLADRLGLYVDSVYNNYIYQSGLSCLIASITYSFQIYGDFAGYSLMAIGTGRLFGFKLINNFNRPYLSTSVTDFWRRWHISLSLWLKDYIYIPLGGSRCNKLKNYRNILLTFLISGIWHGANWNFIIWGILHGFFQIIEKIFNLQKNNTTGIIKAFRIIITFILINTAWIFFRLPSIDDACNVIGKIFTNLSSDLFLPSNSNLAFMLMSLTIVIIKELIEEFFPNKITLFDNKFTIVRWITYFSIVVIILLCGVFDSGQFIYINF